MRKISLLIFVALIMSGCMLILPSMKMIGDNIDSDFQDYPYLYKFDDLQRNQKIAVTNKKNQLLIGKYKGIKSFSFQQYKTIYKINKKQFNTGYSRPEIGEPIYIQDEKNAIISGSFLGFDLGSIWVQDSVSRKKEIAFPQVKTIRDEEGMEYDLNSIKMDIITGKIPILSYMILWSGGMNEYIALNDITKIETALEPVFSEPLFFIGIVADIAIYYILAMQAVGHAFGA